MSPGIEFSKQPFHICGEGLSQFILSIYPTYVGASGIGSAFFFATVGDKLLLLQAALAAKRARELVRTKSVLKSSSLPGKLADCASANPEESGASTFILAICNVLGFTFQPGLGILHTLLGFDIC